MPAKYEGKKIKPKKTLEQMIKEAEEKAPRIEGYSIKQLKAMMPMREERGWILEKYEHPKPFEL